MFLKDPHGRPPGLGARMGTIEMSDDLEAPRSDDFASETVGRIVLRKLG